MNESWMKAIWICFFFFGFRCQIKNATNNINLDYSLRIISYVVSPQNIHPFYRCKKKMMHINLRTGNKIWLMTDMTLCITNRNLATLLQLNYECNINDFVHVENLCWLILCFFLFQFCFSSHNVAFHLSNVFLHYRTLIESMRAIHSSKK